MPGRPGQGEVLGYLGPNGAGKTTTVRRLLGLIQAVPARPGPAVPGQQGNRQILVVVAALMTRAELLVLDEPTDGLDPLMEQAVHEARGRGQSVFLSPHILSGLGAQCDRIGIPRACSPVDIGTLAQVRPLGPERRGHLRCRPPDLIGVPGVGAVEVDGQVLRGQVKGSVEPLSGRSPRAGPAGSSAASPRWRSCSCPTTGQTTVAVLGVVGGGCAWLDGAGSGSGVPFRAMVEAGTNLAPRLSSCWGSAPWWSACGPGPPRGHLRPGGPGVPGRPGPGRRQPQPQAPRHLGLP